MLSLATTKCEYNHPSLSISSPFLFPMTHRSIMFDAYNTIDHSQAAYILANNAATYDAYGANNLQNPGVAPSSNGTWTLPSSHDGIVSPTHPRTNSPNPNFFHHNVQTANPVIQGGYTSYVSRPYALQNHPRPETNYRNTHINSQRRSEQDIVYSMLTPVHPDIPLNHTPTLPILPKIERDVTWESLDPQPNMHHGTNSGVTGDPFNWSPPAAESQFINFDPNWTGTMTSSNNSPEMRLYTPSQGHLFPHGPSHAPSQLRPSSSAAARRQVSPTSSTSSPSTSRRGSVDSASSAKSCSHCHATSTPLWRREPVTLKPLCNACGLYLQQRNKHRPQELIDADAAEDLSDSEEDTSGPECSHCRTHHTSVWRRSKTGAQLCNACGVYSRLRGRDRPLSLKRNRIKPRSKHTSR